MKIFYGLSGIKRFHKAIVALGVFDGVHRGHKLILQAATRLAKRIKGTSIAVTFYPHPQKQESLYSLEHRLKLISEIGLDAAVVINFTEKFSKIPAEDFVKNILLGKLNARFVFVGENFNFGAQGAGDAGLLKELSEARGFKIKVFKVLKSGEKIISSTSIRQLIKKGELNAAEKLLTRPVSVLGTVVKGASLARRLGFPTANIDPHHEVLPPPGVYAVRVKLANKKLCGVCSIGNKPTFEGKRMQHIEVNIFDFKKNIYGRFLEIQFIKKIRNQIKFPTREALSCKIKKDVILAKKILSRH